MLIKGITDEDFINYKFPSLFIATDTCTFKCDKECGRRVCQNSSLANAPTIDIAIDELATRYTLNSITHAVVFGGLEPVDQFDDLIAFLSALRSPDGHDCHDDVVIYTGYTKDEMAETECLARLSVFDNVVIKYGRFIPDQQPHFDPVLGVYLASDNQYAERIS